MVKMEIVLLGVYVTYRLPVRLMGRFDI